MRPRLCSTNGVTSIVVRLYHLEWITTRKAAPNAWPLGKMRALLETLIAIDQTTKKSGFLEADS